MEAQEAKTDEGQAPESESTSESAQEAPAAPNKAPQTFDADYVKGLRSEAAKNRKEAVEAKAKLEEYEDAQKSELERAVAKAQKAEAKQAAAEAQLTRYEVATAKAVPPKMVPLLTASTREELEAQADLILEGVPSPEFDGGTRAPGEAPKSPEEAHNETLLSIFGHRPKQL